MISRFVPGNNVRGLKLDHLSHDEQLEISLVDNQHLKGIKSWLLEMNKAQGD